MKSLLILLTFSACSLQALCQGDVLIGTTKDKVTNFYIMSIRRDRNGSMDVFERVKPSDGMLQACLLYTSPSPRDRTRSRMPSSA